MMTYEEAKVVLELLVLSLNSAKEREAVELAIQLIEDFSKCEDDLK